MEAANAVVEEVEAQQGETKQAKATLKEECPDPDGKTHMFEALIDTLPQTKVSKDAANVASTSNCLLKPSSVDWLVGDLLTKFGGDQ